MRNWSTDEYQLKKNPKKYTIWRLEQLINFGLNGQKINITELKKYFNLLQLDPQKKRYLKFLIDSK